MSNHNIEKSSGEFSNSCIFAIKPCIKILCLTCALCWLEPSDALCRELGVEPHRVVFEFGERYKDVTLVNSGSKKTYTKYLLKTAP